MYSIQFKYLVFSAQLRIYIYIRREKERERERVRVARYIFNIGEVH